jgi:hypothetical protein
MKDERRTTKGIRAIVRPWSFVIPLNEMTFQTAAQIDRQAARTGGAPKWLPSLSDRRRGLSATYQAGVLCSVYR